MKVLMIAPPGAGKGTQGVVIAEHFGIPHIATGDLLREHVARRTELGRSVERYLDAGELVPDEVVLEMVRETLAAQGERGYVLDGLPRTMPQARALYEVAVELDLVADVALHLQATPEELVRRLLARAAEQGRADDTAEVIAKRLALYDEVTAPVLTWYRERGILVSVDAMRPADQVGRQILTALEVVRQMTEGNPDLPRRPVDLTALGASYARQAAEG